MDQSFSVLVMTVALVLPAPLTCQLPYGILYIQVGCACKVIRVHRKMENSLSDFKAKGIYNKQGKTTQGVLRDQNNPRLVRMHQMSMGVRDCTHSLSSSNFFLRERLWASAQSINVVMGFVRRRWM